MNEKGWLTKQIEKVEEDVKAWPRWMLNSNEKKTASQKGRCEDKEIGVVAGSDARSKRKVR